MKAVALLTSHLFCLALGFALGTYALPLLIEPPAADPRIVLGQADLATHRGTFKRSVRGSDFLHWADGKVSLSADAIAFQGLLAPGPDYRIYLAPGVVETKAEFLQVKKQSLALGRLTSFGDFHLALAEPVALDDFGSVVIWCESFEMFISAAAYQRVTRP